MSEQPFKPTKCHDEVLVGIKVITSELQHEVKLVKECIDLMRVAQENVRTNQESMNILITKLTLTIENLQRNETRNQEKIEKNEKKFVSIMEFDPIKKIVYGAATILGVSFMGAIVALVLKGSK